MRVSGLVKMLKQHIGVPIDFHTHCTPGYGLASVLSAILAGVDIVDTNCWYFSEGTGAPAIELIYVFCKKLGIELQANMEAVAKINGELKEIRRELELSVLRRRKTRSESLQSADRHAAGRDRRRVRQGDRAARPATKRRCSTPATGSKPISASPPPTNW